MPDPQTPAADTVPVVPDSPVVRAATTVPADVRAGRDDETLEYWYFCGEGSLLRPD